MYLKILRILIKNGNVDWANPIVQDNLELVYHILKEVIKPF